MGTQLPPYATGSVSIVTGSNTVTGVGTRWLSKLKPYGGDFIVAGRNAGHILSVESDTSLTLANFWPLASVTDAPYSVGRYLSATDAEFLGPKIADLYEELARRAEEALIDSPIRWNAIGTLEGRDAYNSQRKGFVYLAISPLPFRLFVKLSDDNSAASWSLGQVIGDANNNVVWEQALAVEKARAEAAEGTLRTDLTSETTTRKAADDTEKARALEAERVLREALQTEVTNRTAADSTEKDRALEAERVLREGLQTEVNDRKTAITGVRNEFLALQGDSADAIQETISNGLAVLAEDLGDRIDSVDANQTDRRVELEDNIHDALDQRQQAMIEDFTDRIAEVDAGQTSRREEIEDNIHEIMDQRQQAMIEDLDVTPKVLFPYGFAQPAGSTSLVSAAVAAGVLYVYIVLGQSLGLGATKGGFLSTTALYPGRAWMPAGPNGTHVFGEFTDLAPLLETNSFYAHESLCSSFGNHYLRDLDARFPGNGRQIAVFNASIGSRTWAELKRGAPAWNAAFGALKSLYEMKRRENVRVVLAGILFVHGENDLAALWGARYYQMLNQLQLNAQADGFAITRQHEPVMVYVSQSGAVNQFDAAKTGQRLQTSQLLIGERNPYVVPVGPTYAFSRNPDDKIHNDALGAYHLGALFARAVLAHESGQGFAPAQFTDAYTVLPPAGVAARIAVECHLPVDYLVLDKSGSPIVLTGMASKFGFDVCDPDGNYLPIQDVTVPIPSTTYGAVPTVYVDMVAPLWQPWVRLNYAQRRDSDTDTEDGPRQGARGCLRDSANYTLLLDGSKQHNWMSMQSIRVLNSAPSARIV